MSLASWANPDSRPMAVEHPTHHVILLAGKCSVVSSANLWCCCWSLYCQNLPAFYFNSQTSLVHLVSQAPHTPQEIMRGLSYLYMQPVRIWGTPSQTLSSKAHLTAMFSCSSACWLWNLWNGLFPKFQQKAPGPLQWPRVLSFCVLLSQGLRLRHSSFLTHVINA